MLSPIINGITETYDKASKASGDAGVIINEGLKTLGLGILLMLAIYGIGVISMYLQQRIMIGVSQRALKTLRKDLFDHIQTLPVRYFDTNATGDIMSRFTNDVDVVGEMLNNTVIQLIQGCISIVGTVSIMLCMNVWHCAFLAILLVPLMLKAGGSIAKRSSKYYRQQQSALGKLNGYIEETVTGQKVVKVFCHEEKAVENLPI